MMHLRLHLPDNWAAAIDQKRGDRSRTEYVADLILEDLPKRVAAKLEKPKRGRPVKSDGA